MKKQAHLKVCPSLQFQESFQKIYKASCFLYFLYLKLLRCPDTLLFSCGPNGIWTHVLGLKSQCTRPGYTMGPFTSISYIKNCFFSTPPIEVTPHSPEVVIPAGAGIQSIDTKTRIWISAFAEMTIQREASHEWVVADRRILSALREKYNNDKIIYGAWFSLQNKRKVW